MTAPPRSERPDMSGYDVPAEADGVLPWSWAEERLVGCQNFFLVTANVLDAIPHAPRAFWAAFCGRLRRRLAEVGKERFLLLGEVFSRDPLGNNDDAAFQSLLQECGFHIEKVLDLTPNYGKTTAAWNERLERNAEAFKQAFDKPEVGEATFRRWRLYLAGASTGFYLKTINVYRIYCSVR